ncbi:synaptotagmin-like protein 4 isoform X2 [Syngnathoides biaculeatus]|uniref:synaptotagmin-like protein 4 isoform X2 n=1 Tax=Syngnathoides biaculeatus TaxID=300417 RepID=UPI002ADDF238|nr:synaptotagmin-like protein 4 isoform X2 [Syngnathoides biaculeatus]
MPSPSDNIDLGFLSDTERDLILEVLRRDEDLRQAEEQRIRKLKTELLEIKRKGAKRGSGRYSQRSCGRCQGSLSLLAFGSSQCLRCHHLVCSNCRASLPDGSWLCIVCIKESDLRKSTGDWFYNLRVNRFSATPGHELVRSSLRQRPELKKYVTMGDVLLKNSESTQGPPVPVPRQKVNANSRRPSGENAGSVSSMTSFEAKGDAFVYHGPPSEYSGSVASTASFETKGIDGLLKPSQSDTESAEIASLASSKTDTESGRATPDLPRRAILPPLNSHSNVTLLPDAVSIHSYSLEANTGPEIQQAVPSSEFDVDKLFKKSIKRVEDSPDSVNYGVNEQAEVPVDGGGQFVQGLDTQVPEIKQGIPIPEFDVDEYLKKRVKDIENPTEYMNYGLDFCDQSHTYESLADITSHLVQDSDTQVPDRMQDIPRSEFDRDKLFKKSVKHTENSTECVRYEWDLCDQSHIYESLVDIKSQYVQDSDMQVPDINQDIPISEFDVDELFKKSVTHIEDPPERVNYGRDVCVRSHTYESLVDTESQFVQDLDTQDPEITQVITNPDFDVDELFKRNAKHIENPPECVKYGPDVSEPVYSYVVSGDAKRQSVQVLDTQVPEIKQTSPNPEFDVDKLDKSVKHIDNPPECGKYERDVCDQPGSHEPPVAPKRKLVQVLNSQVSEIKQVSASPEFEIDKPKKSVKHVEDPLEYVNYGPDSCDQPGSDDVPVDLQKQFVQGLDTQVQEIKRASPIPEFAKHIENPPGVKSGLDVHDQPDSREVPVAVKRQLVHGLDVQVPEIKEACTSPELELQKLFKKSISRTEHPPDSHGKRDKLTLPMGNRSQSVPDLDMQDDEEEDIDSLVNFHKSTMASSSSLRSTSMTSIYSDSGDSYSVDVRGEVVFTMFYDEPTQSLQVFIKECHKLAYGDTLRQFSNPYVKCYLLPDKSRQSKRKTTIKRHTCDPVYEETFKYSIRRNQLLTRSMLISVWHHGHLSSNPFLGEVEIALDCYDLDSLEEECMALMTKAPCCIPASAFTQFKGELAISLKFVTPKAPPLQKFKGKKVVEVQGGELHVLIKEAKNLMAMKGGVGGMSDSFVKGYLFPSKSKATKRKTAVMKKNLNPHYNHTFVYKELTLEQLQGMCLELTVWDKEPLLSNEFLGGVRLSSGKGSVKMGNDEVGMDSVGEEINLWQKMMQYPDSWAEGTLPLRTTMRKKKGK